jgi:hypothetical protein
MAHEAGSAQSGSPAQASDEDNQENGVATPDAAAVGHDSGSGDDVVASDSPAVGHDADAGDGVATPDAAAVGHDAGAGNGVAIPDAAAVGHDADAGDDVAASEAADEASSDNSSAADHAPGTGDGRVDEALRLLDQLPGLPVSEHPQLFEQVHAQLSEVLGELESGAMPDPAGR